MTKIFISYAREDIESVKTLYNQLASISKIEPWIDFKKLLPGQKWKPTIRKAIRESDYFIIVLSNNSTNKRGFVQKELREAFKILDELPDNKIFLIPIRLESCHLHFEKLHEIHYVDFFPDWNAGLEKVLNVINPENEKKLEEAQKNMLTIKELNTLLKEKVIDKESKDIFPYKLCPQCGYNKLNRGFDYFIDNDSDGFYAIKIQNIECTNCGWQKNEMDI